MSLDFRAAALALYTILSVCSATLPLATEAQQSGKAPRIGVLWPVSDDAELEAFRQGLRELGYIEHQNILIEYRYAQGQDGRLRDLAADLVGLRVDVILTWGVTATKAARQITTAIPIVNGSMSDPVAAGLAKSLSHPGGNVTGLTSMSPTLSAKRLELIREVIPGLSRIAVLSTAAPTAQLGLRETEVAARSLGLSIEAQQVQGPGDFEGAFSGMAGQGAQALIVVPDLLFTQQLKRLIDLAAQHRMPVTYWSRDFVEGGGLMSYGPSWPDQFRRAADYVDRILRGAKAADLPIEGPTNFELVINARTAQALGLTIPQSLLLRADTVIQ